MRFILKKIVFKQKKKKVKSCSLVEKEDDAHSETDRSSDSLYAKELSANAVMGEDVPTQEPSSKVNLPIPTVTEEEEIDKTKATSTSKEETGVEEKTCKDEELASSQDENNITAETIDTIETDKESPALDQGDSSEDAIHTEQERSQQNDECCDGCDLFGDVNTVDSSNSKNKTNSDDNDEIASTDNPAFCGALIGLKENKQQEKSKYNTASDEVVPETGLLCSWF